MSMNLFRHITLLSLSGILIACSGASENSEALSLIDTSRDSNSTGTEITPDTTAPSKPTNLLTTSVATSAVQLQWTASTDNIGVSGYRVYRNSTLLNTVTNTGYQDTTVTANTSYQYYVAAFDAANNTNTSSTLAVTTPAQTVLDTTPPSAPDNLRTSTAPTTSSVALAWNASTDNVSVSGYRVYRNSTLITTVASNSYTDNSVSASTSYTYVVRAFDAANNTADSNLLAVNTPASADTTAPSVPTGLTTTSNTDTSVAISWNASTDNVAVTRYYVYRNSTQIGNVTSRNYTDNSVQASTAYQYRVAAADAAGNVSAQSTILNVTTPAGGNYGVPYTDADFDAIMGNNQVYMAPNGTDSGSCTQIAPCRTFEYAISRMSAGDGLILLDGNYSLAVNGGLRSTTENGTSIARSAQLMSGINESQPTIARALNPGNVYIEGGFTLGNRTQKVQYAIIYGMTFFTPGNLRNADYSVVKGTGIYGRLSVGSIDHSMGCSYNLVEDVWIWGKNERGNAVNYSAHHNIWRRVLIRDDGCDTLYCGEGAGNLKISSTIYNSHDVTFENMISMDKILRANTYGTGSYSDFATAQHDSYRSTLPPEGEQNGRNSWLGSMAINSEDYAINFEAGEILPLPVTTGTIRDFVALDTRAGATIDGAGCPYNSASKYDIDDVYLFSVAGNSIYSGCSSNYVLGSNINTGTYTNNMASGRVPQLQYGTSTPLWPWPYELRIRNDICVRGNFAGTGDEFPNTGKRAIKNFCSSGLSLSNYINSF